MKTNKVQIEITDIEFQKEVLECRQLVLVEFSASWSGLCQIIAPVIEEIAPRFHGRVKFLSLDIDHNSDIAQEYGVQKIPAILFFKDGKVIDYLVGLVSKEILARKLNELLRTET